MKKWNRTVIEKCESPSIGGRINPSGWVAQPITSLMPNLKNTQEKLSFYGLFLCFGSKLKINTYYSMTYYLNNHSFHHWKKKKKSFSDNK